MSDLFQWAGYPERPGFKKRGTSKEAAESVAPKAALLRDKVLALFQRGLRLTADECAQRIKEEAWSVRPRLSELAAAGLIAETAQRRTNRSGHSAAVWRLATELERQHLKAQWEAKRRSR